MAALMRVLLAACTLLMIVVVVESAVIVVGGEKGRTAAFDYDAWVTAQNLQLRVRDSLVSSNPNQVYHTVSLLDSAAASQSCVDGASIHPIPPGTNYTVLNCSTNSWCLLSQLGVQDIMTIPASLESRTLPSTIVSNPNDADVNRYICWTTAVLLIVACFWNSS